MSTFNRWLVVSLVCVMSTLLIAGCASPIPVTSGDDQPVTSKLTEAQARQIIENALQAYNANDRAAYVRDMDDLMRSVITEANFKQLHDAGMQQYGKFVSIEKIELVKAKTPGYVRWDVEAAFEKVKLKAMFGFKPDSDKITGVALEVIN